MSDFGKFFFMKVKNPILQDFKIFERNGLVFQSKKVFVSH